MLPIDFYTSEIVLHLQMYDEAIRENLDPKIGPFPDFSCGYWKCMFVDFLIEYFPIYIHFNEKKYMGGEMGFRLLVRPHHLL